MYGMLCSLKQLFLVDWLPLRPALSWGQGFRYYDPPRIAVYGQSYGGCTCDFRFQRFGTNREGQKRSGHDLVGRDLVPKLSHRCLGPPPRIGNPAEAWTRSTWRCLSMRALRMTVFRPCVVPCNGPLRSFFHSKGIDRQYSAVFMAFQAFSRR